MNRAQLETFLTETYEADIDHPWARYPNYQVFRHRNNKKWFALIMDVPQNKLGIAGNKIVDIANFKCDPDLIGSLRMEKGFFPAYHMNKSNWITAVLDDTADDEKIKILADMSFELTSTKKVRKSEMFVEAIEIDGSSPSNEEWKAIMSEKLATASRFEIHCWNEEQKETEMALQYGRLKKTEWRYGKVIEGAVTKELAEFLLSLPKPSDTEVYNKMTPFFSIFLDNGFSSEHYGTELNGVKENE